MKLALGTVQFGLDYGAFNNSGQVDESAASAILAYATESGIDMLDTARSYGSSEELLGKVGTATLFRTVTKIPPLKTLGVQSLSDSFNTSLKHLRVNDVYGLMMHDVNDLLNDGGDIAWRELELLRSAGVASKIGASVYGPKDALELLNRYPIDIVQLPLNVFDQRHLESGVLDRCLQNNVEVHARSPLLQGFVAGNPAELPEHLARWRPLLQEYQQFCLDCSFTPLEGALRFLNGMDAVSRIVVGVDSLAQLKELVCASTDDSLSLSEWRQFSYESLSLIDPRNWSTTC